MIKRIRLLEKKDAKIVTPLLEELSHHKTLSLNYLFAYLKDNANETVYVYELNDKVVGMMSFRFRQNIEEDSRYAEVSLVIVDKKCRKEGIGRELMEFAEKLAKKYSCKGMWLVSGFGREREAHKFYKKLGYKITGYRFVKPLREFMRKPVQ